MAPVTVQGSVAAPNVLSEPNTYPPVISYMKVSWQQIKLLQ